MALCERFATRAPRDPMDVGGTSEDAVATGPRVVVEPLTATDLPAIGEMTARCSRETIFHRFHGFIHLPTYLETLLTGDQTSVAAWRDRYAVGLASLGPGPRGHELAVLVEDSWQRSGVGLALLEALVDIARAQGLGLLHADVLFEDAYILRVLGRYGRVQAELEYGDYSVSIRLE